MEMEQYNLLIFLHRFIDNWISMIMGYSASISIDDFAYRSGEQCCNFYIDCRMKSRILLSPSDEDTYVFLYLCVMYHNRKASKRICIIDQL